jgi:hypothetical protein
LGYWIPACTGMTVEFHHEGTKDAKEKSLERYDL